MYNIFNYILRKHRDICGCACTYPFKLSPAACFVFHFSEFFLCLFFNLFFIIILILFHSFKLEVFLKYLQIFCCPFVMKEVGEVVMKEVGEAVMEEVGEAIMKEVGEAIMKEVGEAIMKEVGEVVMKGVGDGQGALVCCSPWGCKELDTTERLN